jgi:hypothetical protein
VTIVTHGFHSDADGWVAAMAEAIPYYPSFLGTNFSLYKITLTTDSSGYRYEYELDNGNLPFDTDSGQIIIKFDWSQLAGNPTDAVDPFNDDTSTVIVAQELYDVLAQPNILPDLDGHALVEYPIHLIGHSRGGSLMNELSYILGTNGIWVDHLTTLDPHPLNNDGNEELGFFPTDASATNTWANVLFRDNYWQNYPDGLFDFNGEPAFGAYNRYLDNQEVSGGYNTTAIIAPHHSNVHLWYYGTIDLNTPASDGSATITTVERASWWVPDEKEGTNAGFCSSLIGGSNRLSPATVVGYNQWWNCGAGTNNPNRTALPSNNGTWPNIIKFDVTGTKVVQAGEVIGTTLYYQYAGYSNLTLTIYLDYDFNPYNGNSISILQLDQLATGSAAVSNTNLNVSTTNIMPGVYTVYGRLSDGVHTRRLYAPQLIQITPSQQPPLLSITALYDNQFVIGITGTTGQSIILKSSTDLLNWIPLLTNTLAGSYFSVTNHWASPPRSFYRAMLNQ